MLGGGTQRSNGNNFGVFAAPADGEPQPIFMPIWFAGLPDNSVADVSPESGASNPPPGSPEALDDDYYFAGTYPDPIGMLADDEPLINLERAVIYFNPPNDDTLRFHFNLSSAEARPASQFRCSTGIYQQDGQGSLSVQIEVLCNGTSVDTVSLSEGELYTSPPFSAENVDAIPGANVLTVRQIGGDAQWTNFDFHRMEVKVAPRLPGDWDDDGYIGISDATAFFDCLSGPDQSPPQPDCLTVFDSDTDADVDHRDFLAFQPTFNSP
jgi:hypothetical protein